MDNLTLSAAERHRLLSVLQELDHDAPPEKRTNLRRKVRVQENIRIVEENNAPSTSIIVNVSANGAAIVLSRPLPKKAKFILPLRFRDGGGWLVLCEVRNCVAQPRREWKIGARFVDRIEDPRGTAKPPMDWLL